MEYEYEVNLIELCKYILKKWKILLLSIIVFCLLAVGYAFVKTKTYYSAKSIITVASEDSKNPVQKMSIFMRDDLVEEALKSANSNVSISVAKENLSLTRYDYSNEITVSYKSLNETESISFLRTLVGNAVSVINKVNNYSVSITQQAIGKSSYVSGPSKIKMGILGGIGGLFVSAFCVAVWYILDNRVRDKGFVEKVLKCNTLTEINSGEGDYRKLYANLLLGYREKQLISISNIGLADINVADRVAKYISTVRAKTLLISAGNSDSLGDYILNKNIKAIEKIAPGLDSLSYSDVNIITDYILGGKFKDELNNLKSIYDYIIINTPEDYANTVNTVFNAISDGTILVVKKDVTKAADVIEIKKQLDIVKADILGIVYLA